MAAGDQAFVVKFTYEPDGRFSAGSVIVGVFSTRRLARTCADDSIVNDGRFFRKVTGRWIWKTRDGALIQIESHVIDSACNTLDASSVDGS